MSTGIEEPIKIDKWDGNAVKNALDDAAKKIMHDNYNLVESFKLMDGRLALCTLAVSCSLFALLWDYLNPFPASKPVLIGCVICYFILTGIITAYLIFIESGVFYIGLEKDLAGIDPDNKWTLQSGLKRFDDNYTLIMGYTDGMAKQNHQQNQQQQQQQRSLERTCKITDYFDEEGTLCYEEYEQFVKKMHDDLAKERKEK